MSTCRTMVSPLGDDMGDVEQTRERASCESCHAELVSQTAFCPSCGTRATDSSPVLAWAGASSGTVCCACGSPLATDEGSCGLCGQSIGRDDPAHRLAELVAHSRIFEIVERSSDRLRDRLIRLCDGRPVRLIASHPSRARVRWWALRSLGVQLDRLDEPPDAIAARLAEQLPKKVTILVDRAHRLDASSRAVLEALASRGAAQVVFRAPEPTGGLDVVRGAMVPASLPDELPPKALRIASALAVLGIRAPASVVRAVADVGRLDLGPLAGCVVRDGHELAFIDPDLAEAVERSLEPEARALFHDRALEHYAVCEAPLAIRAQHGAASSDLSVALLLLDMRARAALESGDTAGAREAALRGIARVREAEEVLEQPAVARSGARFARIVAELALRTEMEGGDSVVREALGWSSLPAVDRAELLVLLGSLGRSGDREHVEKARRLAAPHVRAEAEADAELYLAEIACREGASHRAVAHIRAAWRALEAAEESMSWRTAMLAERVLRRLSDVESKEKACALLEELLESDAAPSGGAQTYLARLRVALE